MVKRFLHLLPPGAGMKEKEKLELGSPEFQIDELFDVPGVGSVVGGENHQIVRLIIQISIVQHILLSPHV